jgi:hypothetical protein
VCRGGKVSSYFDILIDIRDCKKKIRPTCIAKEAPDGKAERLEFIDVSCLDLPRQPFWEGRISS